MTNKHTPIPDVGAQDFEHKNSPIEADSFDPERTLRQQVPTGEACYFNGEKFEHGDLVKSGTTVLRCDRGIWIPAGSSDPDNE